MYIRRSTRSYKGRTYTNYVLVESVSTPKGPRQNTICSLGDLSPRPREEWLKLARKIEQALRRLACVMTLNRLIAPSSEHAMPDWIKRTALADILGVDFDGLEEDPLYQVLDKLLPHRAAIEAALVARERSLFKLDQTIYLYDLTSTNFEGQCVRNAKAKRGYSRDHRPDCKQVVVGLV